jgi:hypothetical protein
MRAKRNFCCEKYTTCLEYAAKLNKETVPCNICINYSEASKFYGKLSNIKPVHKRSTVPDGYAGTVEAANILGIGVQKLNYLRIRGIGPDFIQLETRGGLIAYDIAGLYRYLEAERNIQKEPVTEIATPEAAKILGVTTSCLQKMRVSGTAPPP